MDFGSASYGVNRAGILAYEAELNAILLLKVAPTINFTAPVKIALDLGWHGTACDNFKLALDKSAAGLVDTLSKLSDDFHNELEQIQQSIAELDNNMFSDGI